MVWNISISQLGLAAWLCFLSAPAHLLISWIFETWKGPWFLSNWKHQCYQPSSHTTPKAQQLLGGKLSLSQPKPGQYIIHVIKTGVQNSSIGFPQKSFILKQISKAYQEKKILLSKKDKHLEVLNW